MSSNMRCQRDGQRQLHYLVLFKGYLDAYNGWRPAALLQAQGCAEHISSYHQLFNLPLPPTGFSQGEVGIKQLVVTGYVHCTSLGLEESCGPPHVIGIRVTLKHHRIVQLPLSITLAAPPPRMLTTLSTSYHDCPSWINAGGGGGTGCHSWPGATGVRNPAA